MSAQQRSANGETAFWSVRVPTVDPETHLGHTATPSRLIAGDARRGDRGGGWQPVGGSVGGPTTWQPSSAGADAAPELATTAPGRAGSRMD
eukprot:5107281-Prymnesium_polylepis.1